MLTSLTHTILTKKPLSKLALRCGINPLDLFLQHHRDAQEILICWNRGLGDLALGLYALNHRIHTFLPKAQITYLTRADLAPGFQLLPRVKTLIDPTWKRGVLGRLDPSLPSFDCILKNPDPTQWLKWQLGTLTPKLQWNPSWDLLAERFGLPPGNYVGVQPQTETTYGYEKNWPLESWRACFKELNHRGYTPLLFGFSKETSFEGCIDLRGQTTLLEMLSLIKNRCQALIVPDSGVLSLIYFLDVAFSLKVLSLWSDPHQGVLKQGVASPNPLLRHIPLISENLKLLSVQTLLEAFDGP